MFVFFFFKQKTAYEIKECDWSSDVCSSDLNSKTDLKSKDLPKIEVVLLTKNLNDLGVGVENVGERINTFTVSKASIRSKGASQLELSDSQVDGKEFLMFKKTFSKGDYLVVLKNFSTGQFVFLLFRENDFVELEGKQGFYLGNNSKMLQKIGEVGELPTTSTELVNEFEDYRKKGQIEFITFHPAYSYQEFIEGVSFDLDTNDYIVKDGIFKKFCIKAIYRALIISGLEEEYDLSDESDYKKIKEIVLKSLKDNPVINWDEVLKNPQGRFCLIIDEINRGDIAKIFGELITLLEKDKRVGADFELKPILPYSNELFGVPKNVFLVGTMNTADRSIALIDIALRRRFGFVGLSPDFSEESPLVNHLKTEGVYDFVKESIEAIKIINARLTKISEIGKDKCVGHSFFFQIKSKEDVDMLWKNELIPLLEEYCYGEDDLIASIFFGENLSISFSKDRKSVV